VVTVSIAAVAVMAISVVTVSIAAVAVMAVAVMAVVPVPVPTSVAVMVMAVVVTAVLQPAAPVPPAPWRRWWARCSTVGRRAIPILVAVIPGPRAAGTAGAGARTAGAGAWIANGSAGTARAAPSHGQRLRDRGQADRGRAGAGVQRRAGPGGGRTDAGVRIAVAIAQPGTDRGPREEQQRQRNHQCHGDRDRRAISEPGARGVRRSSGEGTALRRSTTLYLVAATRVAFVLHPPPIGSGPGRS